MGYLNWGGLIVYIVLLPSKVKDSNPNLPNTRRNSDSGDVSPIDLDSIFQSLLIVSKSY